MADATEKSGQSELEIVCLIPHSYLASLSGGKPPFLTLSNRLLRAALSSLNQFRGRRGACNLNSGVVNRQLGIDEIGFQLDKATLLANVIDQSFRTEFIGLPDNIEIRFCRFASPDAKDFHCSRGAFVLSVCRGHLAAYCQFRKLRASFGSFRFNDDRLDRALVFVAHGKIQRDAKLQKMENVLDWLQLSVFV